MFYRFEDKRSSVLGEECIRVNRMCKRKSCIAKLYAVLWSELMYETWCQICKASVHKSKVDVRVARHNILFRASIVCNEDMRYYLV